MPNRNISDVDFLVRHAEEGFTGAIVTLDMSFGRHDLGVNIHSGILSGDFTSGTASIQILHSDEPTAGFELIPEEDILTPTDDYPNYLPADAALAGTQSLPFVQLKAFKRYLRVTPTLTGVNRLTVAIASRSNFSPADTDGAIIPKG